MLKANDSSNYWFNEDFFDSDDLSIDVESLLAILGETPDPSSDHSLSSPEDLSCKNVSQSEGAPDAVNDGDCQTQNGIPGSAGALSVRAELPGASVWYPSDYLDPSCSREGMISECLFEPRGNSDIMFGHGKLETSVQIGSPVHSASLADWISEYDTSSMERVGASESALPYIGVKSEGIQYQIPNCSTNFNFSAGDANPFLGSTDKSENVFERVGGDVHSTCASYSMMVEQSVSSFGKSNAISGSSREIIEAPEGNLCSSPMEICFLDADTSLQNAPDIELDGSQVSDILYETIDHFSPVSFSVEANMDADDTPFADCSRQLLPDAFNFPFMSSSKEKMICIKDEVEKYQTEKVRTSTAMNLVALEGRTNKCLPELPLGDYTDINSSQVTSSKCEDSKCFPPISRSSSNANGHIFKEVSRRSLPCTQSSMSSNKRLVCIKEEINDKLLAPKTTNCKSVEFIGETVGKRSFSSASDARISDEISQQSFPCVQSSMPCNKNVVRVKDEIKDELCAPNTKNCQSLEYIGDTVGRNSAPGADDALFGQTSRQSLPDFQASMSSKNHMAHVVYDRETNLLESKSICNSIKVNEEATSTSYTVGEDSHFSDLSLRQSLPDNWTSSRRQIVCVKDEREDKLIPTSNVRCPVNVTGEVVQCNPCSPAGYRSYVDDDADICILEDISDPVHPPLSVVHGRSLVTSQRSTMSDPLHPTGTGGMRLKTNDERLTFRVALQDLSQPKSEASPPDGALAVPLLRHQRIALSWMVQKETASLHCCGGILADDQGLGKTISTIALILKERSPSSMAMKQSEREALNLDEDDAGVPELDGTKQDGSSVHFRVNSSVKSNILAKGRPAAGTLVVCPTSVLRQWAEELHNKVTSKGNISVLVYHGSNRTKDPHELAKYDVVLTTYSIVSMEVPKQPLVDKDDDEKGKPEAHGLPHVELSSSRKRKYPPSSNKKSRMGKKGLDNALLESVARPLARVGWFRVVLDEAQSIKNHRTQVARACWGLRAKRRWCLSGTPIQNAVDDLYSYFRFLRYDPYAVYKSFCSMIKIPINRNPTTGYKKLQAVLKTIMLRRTKGTLLDGEPIINLPPKSVEMKKVDFSKEERDFYARLEADSRAQFKVYAAAGTVKQNYVNILLMLLRLRQACDHPRLVRGYDSNSCWRSSVEVARKLPREKQMGLLNCLEACLAICGICNDPPEDAVVTICGHVFCNQCICEHLTGDDNLCPAAHCKIQLSVTSVFSRATLKSSLSGLPGQDGSLDNSGSELAEILEPCLEDPISDSSKIKAALEFLQSLSKSKNCALNSSSLNSYEEVFRCPENSSDSHLGELSKDMANKIPKVDEGFNGSNTKVVEKAIVFSQWTRMLDLLEVRLKSSSIQYRRLDGTMSVVARDKAVKDFNNLPEVTVMIMSLKAASLGLNMVAACHVLLLDLWWNPTTEDQAIDRAHRIGQTRPVTVFRFTVKDTVEDRILALQQKKREMVASAFGEDETGSRQTRLTVDDLKYLFMV